MTIKSVKCYNKGSKGMDVETPMLSAYVPIK